MRLSDVSGLVDNEIPTESISNSCKISKALQTVNKKCTFLLDEKEIIYRKQKN